MSAHTPGPWAYEIIPNDDAERRLPRSEWSGLYIGPESDEGGSPVSHTIFEGAFTHGPKDGDPEDDARLIAAANTAPHECSMPSCPGGRLFRLLRDRVAAGDAEIAGFLESINAAR